jgi:hypothetical protein
VEIEHSDTILFVAVHARFSIMCFRIKMMKTVQLVEKGKKTSSNNTCLQQTETLCDGMERDVFYAPACLL